MRDPNDSGAPKNCWRLARTLVYREALVRACIKNFFEHGVPSKTKIVKL